MTARPDLLTRVTGLVTPLLGAAPASAVAVSGGADSMALLHIIARAPARAGASRLVVLHVNHGLRGAESDRDEAFVRAEASRLGLPVEVGRTASAPRNASEGETRRRRYQVFEEMAAKLGLAFLFLAHHRDDQIETILQRILRDAGPGGAAGMPFRRPLAPGARCEVVRPLLAFDREDLRGFLRDEGISWVEDSSNVDNRFQRNRIRGELARVQGSARRRGLDAAVARFAESAGRLGARLAAAAEAAARGVIVDVLPGRVLLAPDRVALLPPALVHGAFVEILRRESGRNPVLSPRHVRELVRFVRSETRSVGLPGGVRLVRDRDAVAIVRRSPRRFRPAELPVPGSLLIDERGVTVVTELRPPPAGPWREDAPETMDADAIRPPLFVRQPLPTDRFRPLGASVEMRLSNFMKKQRLSRIAREAALVVADEDGIVCVPGRRIAERVRVTDATRRTIVVTTRRSDAIGTPGDRQARPDGS